LQNLIKSTLHSEALYYYAKEILKDESISEVERAWAFWVQTNMSFSNVISVGFSFSNDKDRCSLTKNKRDAFEIHFKKRVEKVEIFCRDAIDIIKLKDGKDTFFYIDPPYVSSDCGHYKGYTKDNFIELLELLSNIQGKFLLSSYPEPELEKYTQWNKKQIQQHLSVSHTTLKDTKTECLTYNYELSQQKLF
jgi:DNA adenine methylase